MATSTEITESFAKYEEERKKLEASLHSGDITIGRYGAYTDSLWSDHLVRLDANPHIGKPMIQIEKDAKVDVYRRGLDLNDVNGEY